MSNFLTHIPVDIEAIKKLLPAGAHVEGVSFNGTEIELRWAHHRLDTPWTFHVEFTPDQLRARKLPEGVSERKSAAAVQTASKSRVGPAPASRKSRRT